MKLRKLLIGLLVCSVMVLLAGCENFPIGGAPGAHEHTYSEDWSSDASNHWHAATCEHTEEVSELAEHTWNEGVVTKEATEEAAGEMTYTCTVCSYEKVESIDKLEHTHKFAEEWSSDENNHWHVATCEHTEEVSALAEHTWGEAVVVEPTLTVNGSETYACTVCGYEKVVVLDRTGVFTNENWTPIGKEDAYHYVGDTIVCNNQEDILEPHFSWDQTNYNLYNTEVGANYSLTLNIKGTWETDVKDTEIDAGLVVWYQDSQNFLVVGVKWASWDRPHEIRSLFLKGYINGEKYEADEWTDNCGTTPADGASIEITKVGSKIKYVLKGYGLYQKTNIINVVGIDTPTSKVGIYGANDALEFTNFSAETLTGYEYANYTGVVNGETYNLALSTVNDEFTLSVGDESISGTYVKDGRTVVLTPANGLDPATVKITESGLIGGTFELVIVEEPEETDPNAIVIDGTSGRQTATIAENVSGDYTLEFEYEGLKDTSSGAAKVGGYVWYVDDANYIEMYIEWSASDRAHEIRCVQITGHINGAHVGWNDKWCDGSGVLPADGGKMIIRKVGNTFSFELVSGEFTKIDSATIGALDTSLAYNVALYAEGDQVTYSWVNFVQDLSGQFTVNGDGAEKAVITNKGIILDNASAITNATQSGDYSVTFNYLGTNEVAGTAARVGFYAWYVDENNYIEVYVEWSASDRAHEIRCIQITGHINGQHVGWNDIWCDGSNVLPADGGQLTITKTGNTFTASIVSGTYSKNGAATIGALDTSLEYKVGFYSMGDEITWANIVIA